MIKKVFAALGFFFEEDLPPNWKVEKFGWLSWYASSDGEHKSFISISHWTKHSAIKTARFLYYWLDAEDGDETYNDWRDEHF